MKKRLAAALGALVSSAVPALGQTATYSSITLTGAGTPVTINGSATLAAALEGQTLDGLTLGNTTPAVRLNLQRGFITEPAATAAGNNYAAQVYANFSGTGGTGAFEAPVSITIPGDTLSYTGMNYVEGLNIVHNFGGAGHQAAACEGTASLCGTGARAVANFVLDMVGPTSNIQNTNYVGTVEEATSSFNDGGVAGYALARGQITTDNQICGLYAGATYYAEMSCDEADIAVAAGASVRQKLGMILQEGGGDAVQGTSDDIGLNFNSESGDVGWNYLIGNSRSGGYPATNANSTVLGCSALSATACPAKYGIDFLNNWNWAAGSYPFRSVGFSVDNQGNEITNGLTTSTISAPPRYSVTAIKPAAAYFGGTFSASSPAVVTIAAPSSGTTATAAVTQYTYTANQIVKGGSGYVAGDTLLCNGTHLSVTAVSGGAITADSYAGGNPPVTSLPALPYTACTGGSGAGVTLNLYYTPYLIAVTNPGSGYSATPPLVTFSGNVPGYSQAAATATVTRAASSLAIDAPSISGGSLNNAVATGNAISGGTIIGTPISGSTGSFTTLTVAGAISGAGVTGLLSTYAPVVSPALAGTPTAPTQAAGDASNAIATDAFVQNAVSAAGAAVAATPYVQTNNAGYSVLGMASAAGGLANQSNPHPSTQFFWPIGVPSALAWTKLGIDVISGQAGSSCNVGIYSDILVGGVDKPQALLAATGVLSLATTGIVSAPLSPAGFSPKPGVKYWASEICNGSSESLRALGESSYAPSLGLNSGMAHMNTYISTQGSGTVLPANAAGNFSYGYAMASGPGMVIALQ
jgi:hypothetical protein